MAEEVVVSDYSVGIREYDIVGRKQLFMPMYYGMRLYVEGELGLYLKAQKKQSRLTSLSIRETIEGGIRLTRNGYLGMCSIACPRDSIGSASF